MELISDLLKKDSERERETGNYGNLIQQRDILMGSCCGSVGIERSFPTPEVCGSNPVMGNFL